MATVDQDITVTIRVEKFNDLIDALNWQHGHAPDFVPFDDASIAKWVKDAAKEAVTATIRNYVRENASRTDGAFAVETLTKAQRQQVADLITSFR